MNLAVNARDAMPGGGSLRILTAEQVVDDAWARLHPDASPGRYVCLQVSDTGSGIPPEDLPHVFEPFFTTKKPGEGTGLGLATVFGIVKQHRGWIDVQSAAGRGTDFRVFLPALATAEVVTQEAARPAPRGGTETILLVEDDPAVRELAREILEQRGYRVLEASSGAEALRRLAGGARPGGASADRPRDARRRERPRAGAAPAGRSARSEGDLHQRLQRGRCWSRVRKVQRRGFPPKALLHGGAARSPASISGRMRSQ